MPWSTHPYFPILPNFQTAFACNKTACEELPEVAIDGVGVIWLLLVPAKKVELLINDGSS